MKSPAPKIDIRLAYAVDDLVSERFEMQIGMFVYIGEEKDAKRLTNIQVRSLLCVLSASHPKPALAKMLTRPPGIARRRVVLVSNPRLLIRIELRRVRPAAGICEERTKRT